VKWIELSDSVVRAILDGRKTVMRQVIRPQPDWVEPEPTFDEEGRLVWCDFVYDRPVGDLRSCCYGDLGDKLGVEARGRMRRELYTMVEITGICVERVQSITEQDVLAEGHELREWTGHPEWPRTAAFAEAWDKDNFKSGYRWEDNPWVWVIQFLRDI